MVRMLRFRPQTTTFPLVTTVLKAEGSSLGVT